MMSDRRPENRPMCCETSAHASDCPNNPNSLGFDEPGLWMVDEWIDEGVVGAMHKPSDADLIAEIRSRVESGTIKGEVRWLTPGRNHIERHKGHLWATQPNKVDGQLPPDDRDGYWVLVIPVSDGGSET